VNGAALAMVPEKRIHAQPSFLDRIERRIHTGSKGKIQPSIASVLAGCMHS
jgi:hypothetical protein